MARPARPKPARHRPSSIDKLDTESRELIGKLRMDHGWTIDEILQRLIDMGQSVSRSALGRHVRTLQDISAEMREAQAMATALAREVGNSDQSQMLDLNSQLLQANMFKLMLAANEDNGEGIQLSAKDAKAFADALRSIALTRKTELDVIEKAEARAAAKAKVEAADSATKVARSKGLSKDTVEAIRRAVLGSD